MHKCTIDYYYQDSRNTERGVKINKYKRFTTGRLLVGSIHVLDH